MRVFCKSVQPLIPEDKIRLLEKQMLCSRYKYKYRRQKTTQFKHHTSVNAMLTENAVQLHISIATVFKIQTIQSTE